MNTGFVEASYIFFPCQGAPLGHAELEIREKSYTLSNIATIKDKIITQVNCYDCYSQIDVGENRNVKSLPKMVERARSGYGLSFFRFKISVTENQLRELKKNALRINSISCSIGVAKAFKQYTDFKIPLPFAISPLASALYLATAHKLGSQYVRQIEFYGNNSLKNRSKRILGILGESAGLVILASTITSNLWDIYYFTFDDDSLRDPSKSISAIKAKSAGLFTLVFILLDGYYFTSCSNLLKNSSKSISVIAGNSIGFLSTIAQKSIEFLSKIEYSEEYMANVGMPARHYAVLEGFNSY